MWSGNSEWFIYLLWKKKVNQHLTYLQLQSDLQLEVSNDKKRFLKRGEWGVTLLGFTWTVIWNWFRERMYSISTAMMNLWDTPCRTLTHKQSSHFIYNIYYTYISSLISLNKYFFLVFKDFSFKRSWFLHGNRNLNLWRKTNKLFLF